MNPRKALSALGGSKIRLVFLAVLVLGGAVGGGFALGTPTTPSAR